MDISLQLSNYLCISIWISSDFYGYPCIDLLDSRSREPNLTYVSVCFKICDCSCSVRDFVPGVKCYQIDAL